MPPLPAGPATLARSLRLLAPWAVTVLVAMGGCVDVPEQSPPAPAVTPDRPPTDPPQPPVDVFAVSSAEPASGPISGFTQVELRGTGLADVVEVRFGETAALETLALTDDRVVALSPPRPRGAVDLTVVTQAGETAVLHAAFRYVSDVRITEVVPRNGDLLGGEPVTVSGYGFSPDMDIVFGTRRALAIEVVNETTAVAITPEGASLGLADVHVAAQQGVGTLRGGFEYYTAPQVFQIRPPAGLRTEAHEVDIIGTGFTTPLAVTVGGRPASDVRVLDAQLLRAVFPPSDAVGPSDVVISTPFGTTVATGGFTYLPENGTEGLAFWALQPSRGTVHGGTHVTLTVTGALNAVDTNVRFGDIQATILRVDADAALVEVSTPPATEAGPVDVSVSVGDAVQVLPQGFVYEAAPQIHAVQPNHGPSDGGTAVTISGLGFAAGAAVRIGALAATAVDVVDERTIQATTASGSPGLSNVTVVQNGAKDTLYGGFVYTGPLDLFMVTPSLGSQAGGTRVVVTGSGFRPDTQVAFGGRVASDVTFISASELVVLTPPGMLGSVDVEVGIAGATAMRPKGFTYYDPSSEPGTWGPPVDGNVNVTVVDAFTRQPVEGAAVTLGDAPGVNYRGFTDANGQITFGGDDIVGPQVVTVSGSAYATAQLQGFDAENVAVTVDPELTCSQIEELIPCDGPSGGQQAQLDGEVKAPFKGTANPVGSCEDATAPVGTLCLTCSDDLDCSDGELCTELQDQGSVCVSPCETDAQCPADFACLPLGPQWSNVCVPSAGELRTYCDVTEFGLSSEQAIPWPGILVDADGQFDMPSRLGNFAVYCWSGLYRNGRFTPQKLGVLRNQGAFEDGQLVETTIEMNHPLNTPVNIELDRPDIGPPTGTESVRVRIALDLGSDGILDFPELTVSGRDALQTMLPETLTGSLDGAKWVIIATVTNAFLPNAYSTTWERGFTDINSDRAFRLVEGSWKPATGSRATVRSIAADGVAAIAVGDGGQILRSFSEDYWALMQSGTTVDLYAVAAAPDGTALAGGAGGELVAFDGIAWKPVSSDIEHDVVGVASQSATEAVAVAGGEVWTLSGTTWTMAYTTTGERFLGVSYGRDGAIWAVGEGGLIVEARDGSWTVIPTATGRTLHAIHETANGDVFAVGQGGVVLRRMDGVFVAVDAPATSDLRAMWESPDGDLWVVGHRGTVLRRDTDGLWYNDSPAGYRSNFLAIGGVGSNAWAMGSHEFVMGPMMAVPESIRPGGSEPLGGPWSTLSWSAADRVEPDFSVVTFGGMIGPCTACGMTFMLPYDEWRSVSHGSIDHIVFADLSDLTGKPFLESGNKPVSIVRAYMDDPGFDFDKANADDFDSSFVWRSWAGNEANVLR